MSRFVSFVFRSYVSDININEDLELFRCLCVVWVAVISSRTGGQPQTAPLKATGGFPGCFVPAPQSSMLSRYPAWSKDEMAHCAVRRRPDAPGGHASHWESPPRGQSRASQKLSRRVRGPRPRSLCGTLWGWQSGTNDWRVPTLGKADMKYLHVLLCKTGKSHFGLIQTDSRSGLDSELFQREF